MSYNPITRAWTNLAPMLTPRSQMGITILDGYIYVVGGTNKSQEVLTSVERYSFEKVRSPTSSTNFPNWPFQTFPYNKVHTHKLIQLQQVFWGKEISFEKLKIVWPTEQMDSRRPNEYGKIVSCCRSCRWSSLRHRWRSIARNKFLSYTNNDLDGRVLRSKFKQVARMRFFANESGWSCGYNCTLLITIYQKFSNYFIHLPRKFSLVSYHDRNSLPSSKISQSER